MSRSWATTAPANRPSCARSPAVEQRTSGQIFFDGAEISHAGPLEAREAGIETVFQTLALADDLDVPSNLFLGRELFKFRFGPFSWLDRKTMRDRDHGGAGKDGGEDPQCRQPDPQHVGRSAAMRGHRPHGGLCLASLSSWTNPRRRLGVQETAQVENIIKGLKDRGVPMILVSHNLRQVFDLVDRIVVFRRGRIVASLKRDETDGNDIVSYITGVKGSADAAFA